MKKSTIIIIGIIYIASIIFIGFFGMKITAYNETIYVTGIECINEEVERNEDNNVIFYTFKDDVSEDENVFLLAWKLYPENCSNKGVKFIYDKDSNVASIDKNGMIWIKNRGVLTFQIVSDDKDSVKEEIILCVI